MRVCVESNAISFVTDINTTVNGTRQTTNANCTKAMPETVFFFIVLYSVELLPRLVVLGECALAFEFDFVAVSERFSCKQ